MVLQPSELKAANTIHTSHALVLEAIIAINVPKVLKQDGRF